jgi:phosphoribosylformimino-5-aminoimidazole carboxamide ribotide isomerase
MLVIPAIDLKDGKCVRLYQGEMDSAKIYSDSPEEIATRWENEGAKLIHVVDLDGAVAGEPRNLGSIARILETIDTPIELGGGIRSKEIVEDYLQLGVSCVIIGTAAYKDPEMTSRLCEEFPGRIAVGIDAKGGFVAVQGWQEVTEKRAVDLAVQLQDAGVSYIIYTDITRDGALSGPNLEATAELAREINIPVVLSGGMHSHEDIIKVATLEDDGVKGVILGRSLYEGTIDLPRAIEDVQKENDVLCL